MIDTPESAMQLLNENDVKSLNAVLFSHFHPDHTLGLRAISQSLLPEKTPFDGWENQSLDVYMPEHTRRKLISESGITSYLLENNADITTVESGDRFEIGNTEVEAVGWRESKDSQQEDVFGYLFRRDSQTVFVSPDENANIPTRELPELDLWIKECGLFGKGPDGDALRTDEFWNQVMETEQSFEQSMSQVKEVDADQVILTEIEEVYRRTPMEYHKIQQDTRQPIMFGHDGMTWEKK